MTLAQTIEHALRRVRRVHERTGKPVGVDTLRAELVLFGAWDDRYGRLRCLAVSYRGPINGDEARRWAWLALGPDVAFQAEQFEPSDGMAWFAVGLDERLPSRPWLDWRLPAWWRRYRVEEIGAGFGPMGRMRPACGRYVQFEGRP